MSKTPPLSVVMSVRNVARYVAQAIDSVLSQTFRDYEFIVIDDGSKDETAGILADYARRDPRIRLLRGPERGLSAALNLGIEHARAPLLARMDGDDVCLPARLQKQVAFLDANPDHVMVGSRCVLIDPDGCPIHEKPGIPLAHDQIDAMLLRMEWPLVHPAIMMRADAFKKTGGYLERYKTVEDHDVFLKLAEIGKLANVNEVLFLYRQHFQSTVYTTAEAQVRNLVEIATAACADAEFKFHLVSLKDRLNVSVRYNIGLTGRGGRCWPVILTRHAVMHLPLLWRIRFLKLIGG